MNDIRKSMNERQFDEETLISRYALRVAASLTARSEAPGHHVEERLRVARERALDRARASRAAAPAPSIVVSGGGAATLALGGGPGPAAWWWHRLSVLLPLLALVAGLALIQVQHARLRTAAVAEVDMDLLADELPPTAYSDPGFVEFLRTARQ